MMNENQPWQILEYVRNSFFFFFQAEDGIRDYKVTGVQTCALPICAGGVRVVVAELRSHPLVAAENRRGAVAEQQGGEEVAHHLPLDRLGVARVADRKSVV